MQSRLAGAATLTLGKVVSATTTTEDSVSHPAGLLTTAVYVSAEETVISSVEPILVQALLYQLIV